MRCPTLAMQAEANALAAAEAEDLAHCREVLVEGKTDGASQTQSAHDAELSSMLPWHCVLTSSLDQFCDFCTLHCQVLVAAEERAYAEAIVHGGGEPDLVPQAIDKQLETAR